MPSRRRAARRRARKHRHRRRSAEADGLARPRQPRAGSGSNMTSRSAPTPSSAPGGDAAVVRVHGTDKALAITTDCTPRYCYADPYRGRQAGDRRGLAQPLRGRRPPARRHRLPEFRQPAAARDHGPVRRLHRGHGRGLPRARFPDRERQRLLYNETKADDGGGSAILPTPAIGGVGLARRIGRERRRSGSRRKERHLVLAVGSDG